MNGWNGRVEQHDVLVVGAGPAGATAAYWLAERGWDVVLLERKRFPRDKTCGDGLTPRAVRQLWDMGLAPSLEPFHSFGGLRAVAHELVLEMRWPRHPELPQVGYVVPRRHLDEMVAARAVDAGAALWQQSEAVEPLVEDGTVTGAKVCDRASSDKWLCRLFQFNYAQTVAVWSSNEALRV